MQLESEVKLDYKDVLIRPKRSTLKSRSEVSLERKTNFRNYIPDFPDNCSEDPHYRGVPIMAANMDGVGTFAMADELGAQGIFTCLVKTYTAEELIEFFYGDGLNRTDYVAMSIGTSTADFEKLCAVYAKCEDNLKYVCIDIANGYSEHFAEHVREVRKRFPHLVIIAGNVVTREMTEELILAGADIIKVGIGPGCFAPGQKVKTDKCLKNIEDIKQGEKVLTHTGSYKTVTNTFKFDDKKSIVNINGIKATPNHEFYVLHKKHRETVTDDNIHQYAEWVEAKDLTKDYLLLKHKYNTIKVAIGVGYEI